MSKCPECDRGNEDRCECHAYNNGLCMNAITCGCIMAHSPIKTISNQFKFMKINGTGNKPQDEVMSKSVIRRLAVQKPQDEIREAFDILWGDSYHDETQLNSELDPKREFDVFKSGYNSSTTRYEAELYDYKSEFKRVESEKDDLLEELKKREALLDKAVEVLEDMKDILSLENITSSAIEGILTEIKEKR